MTRIGIAIRLFLAFAMVLVVLNVRDRYGKHKDEVGYTRGVSESLGRPMKYSEMPIGEYTVVAVVDKYKPYTVVVRRDSRAVGYVAPEYLLVIDMMPNMVEEHYIFTVGGTQ